MLSVTLFITLIILLNTGSILSAPQAIEFSDRNSLSPRQLAGNQNGGKNLTGLGSNAPKNVGGTNPPVSPAPLGSGSTTSVMSEEEKEAKEQAEENKPSLKTIGDAISELYYHDKYGSQRHDTAVLVKYVGQAVATHAKTADPETISKAILATFEPYNQGKKPLSPTNTPTSNPSSLDANQNQISNPNGSNPGSSSNAKPATTTDSNPEPATLKTIGHSLKECWEKQLFSTNQKVENSQLIPVVCMALATSAMTTGDPSIVVKAIDSACSKIIPAGNSSWSMIESEYEKKKSSKDDSRRAKKKKKGKREKSTVGQLNRPIQNLLILWFLTNDQWLYCEVVIISWFWIGASKIWWLGKWSVMIIEWLRKYRGCAYLNFGSSYTLAIAFPSFNSSNSTSDQNHLKDFKRWFTRVKRKQQAGACVIVSGWEMEG